MVSAPNLLHDFVAKLEKQGWNENVVLRNTSSKHKEFCPNLK